MKLKITYILIFVFSVLLMLLLPLPRAITWETGAMIALSALLFTLLVYLSCRLAGTGSRAEGVLCTCLFLLFFLPELNSILSRDLDAVVWLGSQCIVPFFISQYKRTSERDFKFAYILMLLMGIFCSYTHDGVTIPICLAFLWISQRSHNVFFRSACWPMVIGFLIGTSLSIWQNVRQGQAGGNPFMPTISVTINAIQILWDTKVFLFSIILTSYLTTTRKGRQILLATLHDNQLLSFCAIFAFCALPFAPLGLENAVTGVCFFCMYWLLLLVKAMAIHYYYTSSSNRTNLSISWKKIKNIW